MNAYVLIKMAPDPVEELNVANDGKSLDSEFLRFKCGDPEEHSLEQALLLKERCGGRVTVVALDAPEVDDVLYTALAKGADSAVKINLDQTKLGSIATAYVFASYFVEKARITEDTLIMPGTQSIDDIEGEMGAILAELLELPYVGVVSGLNIEGVKAIVIKEFRSGIRGEYEVQLPAVFGIQSAEKPPRYVPVAKVRAAMKSSKIETVELSEPQKANILEIERMYKPEVAGRAQIIEGDINQVAARLAEIFAERGII
ncbi:MAG: electron transfer flavoprotein subunit beta/FixA family protein [Limisphaerales bacterium]|jgi:electron transfer flavoprotein beta subunit